RTTSRVKPNFTSVTGSRLSRPGMRLSARRRRNGTGKGGMPRFVRHALDRKRAPRFSLCLAHAVPGFWIHRGRDLHAGAGYRRQHGDIRCHQWVILRPLPYLDPDRLVSIEQVRVPGGVWSFSYPDYLDCASQSSSFQSIAAWRNRGANLTAPGEPDCLTTRQVSASFLQVLRVHPLFAQT